MRWRGLQRFIFTIFLALIASSIIIYYILGDNISLEQIRQYLRNFGIWTSLVFIIFYALGTIFIPSTPFMAIAGILFGFKYGLIYSIIGGLLSSIVVFHISRRFGKDWAEKILQHEYMERLSDYNRRLESGAIWDLILLRIAPVMPFNVLNILMGISRINLRDYLIGTVLGLLPSSTLTVYFSNFVIEIL